MPLNVDHVFAVAFACLGVSQDELAETVKILREGGWIAYG
jgi:hypothetical protein